MSNIKKLQTAGMIAKPHRLTKAHQELVESLSAGEVKSLIGIKKKLGRPFIEKTTVKNKKVRADTLIL